MQQFCKVLTSNVTVKPFLRLRLSLREKFPNTEFFLVRIFRVFGLNTEICGVNLRNESECRKMRTRKNSLFGHLSRSVSCLDLFSWNVENWEASFKETKNSISKKLRYFHCFNHSLSYGVKNLLSKHYSEFLMTSSDWNLWEVYENFILVCDNAKTKVCLSFVFWQIIKALQCRCYLGCLKQT